MGGRELTNKVNFQNAIQLGVAESEEEDNDCGIMHDKVQGNLEDYLDMNCGSK